MLPLLASLVLTQAKATPFPNATAESTVKALAALGYRYVPDKPGDSFHGRLAHGGLTMDAMLFLGKALGPIDGIRLTATLPLARRLPGDPTTEGWTRAGAFQVVWRQGTVNLWTEVLFGSNLSMGTVGESLNRVWREVALYAKARGGIARDRPLAKTRFSDRDVLTQADEGAIFPVLESWGWPRVPTSNLGVPTDWKWGAVKAHEAIFMLVYGWNAKRPDRLFYAWSGLDFPKGIKAGRFVADQRRRLPGVDVSGGASELSYSLTFDLSRGMTLGAIRRRFEAVARAQASLRKRYRATPQDAF